MFSLALDNVLPPRWQPHRRTFFFPLLPLVVLETVPPPPTPTPEATSTLLVGTGGREWGERAAFLQLGEAFSPQAIPTGMEAVSPREGPRIIVIMVTV